LKEKTMTAPKPIRIARMAVAALFAGSCGLAWAHAHPKSAMPAADAVVAAPAAVDIEFSEALEPAFSTLTVSDLHGRAVTNTKAEVDASAHKRLHLPLPVLAPGDYEVNWVAVSVDGHRTSGHYRFTIRQ
jgi:methionine-rich copper-binding protein CopC